MSVPSSFMRTVDFVECEDGENCMCKVLRIVLDIQQASWKCKVFGMMMMGLDFKFVLCITFYFL